MDINEILNQKVNEEELQALKADGNPCSETLHRSLDDDGCASTVDVWSWCESADACYDVSVAYDKSGKCHGVWD